MFYEAMENVLPDVKVVIQSKDGNMNTILPLDSFVTQDEPADGAADASGSTGGTDTDADEDAVSQ